MFTVNDALAVSVASETETVITVDPVVTPMAVVRLSERVLPLPPSTRFAAGTIAWFEEDAVTTSASGSVVSSPTVNRTGGRKPF